MGFFLLTIFLLLGFGFDLWEMKKREELCNEIRPTKIHTPPYKARSDQVSSQILQIFQVDFELRDKQCNNNNKKKKNPSTLEQLTKNE